MVSAVVTLFDADLVLVRIYEIVSYTMIPALRL